MNTELKQRVLSTFKQHFAEKPLLVFAPGRINLIGEHTDYNEGFVFPAAIDKGILAALSKSDSAVCTVFAKDIDESYQFDLAELHPLKNGDWKNYVIGVCAEVQKKGHDLAPFNLVFAGDIPNGAGLSSSAALENSVVFGLNELFDLGLTKTEMIAISQKAEHNFVGVQCGIMDQYASMFGEKNRALLLDCRSLQSESYQLKLQDYSLLLINTNVSHKLVEAEYNDRRAVCEKIAGLLNLSALRDATEASLQAIKHQLSASDFQKALYVIQENERVLKAGNMLANDNLEGFGTILYEGHKGVSTQFKVSCEELDFLVAFTQHESRILGARMMGGGFGGCTINIVKKTFLEQFKEDIGQAYFKKFNKECSFYPVHLGEGVHLVN